MRAYLDHSLLLGAETGERIYTTLFPPGYTWLLWLAGKVVDIHAPQPVLYVQALMGACTTLAIAGIARCCYGMRTALVAATAYTLYKPAVLFCGVMLSEIQAEFFSAFTLYTFLLYLRSRSTWQLLLVGLLASAAMHTRVNLAALPFIIGLWLLIETLKVCRDRKLLVSRLRHLVMLTMLVIITAIPWSVRNSKITGRVTFLSTNGAMNMFQGNHPYTNGGWYDGEMPDPLIQDALNLPFNEQMAQLGKLAKEFAQSHPVYELFYLVPQRFHYIYLTEQTFWPWEFDLPSNYATHPFGPWIKLPLLTFNPVLIWGLLGLLFAGRRRRGYLVSSTWLLLLAPLLMVHGNARFHYVSDFLLILSGSAVLSKAIRRRNFFKVLVGTWSGVVVYTCVASLVQYARFGGENLLLSAKAQISEPLGASLISGTAEVDLTTGTATEMMLPIAEVMVSPGLASHLLMSAEFKVDVPDPYQKAPQVRLQFLDVRGTTVTSPVYPSELIPPRVALNPTPVDFQKIQRIVLVPASARKMELWFSLPFKGSVKVRNLRLTGPIWDVD